ncbi:MAG: SDR family NAD(P)-dependent oxidoreductase [Myxococcota bacterium]
MTTPARVFVTGASSGLGHGLALHYAREGAVLGLVARRAPLLEDLKRQCEERGAAAYIFPGDVADTARMKASVDEYLAQAGGIDLVIANAGVGIKSALLEGRADEVAWLMGINVVGVTNTVVPFVPAMVRQGSGILVAMGSVAGHRAVPGRAAYAASKACVKTFMDGLRMDLAGTGVHAMTLMPGFVDTPLTKDNPQMFFVLDVDTAVTAMSAAIEGDKRTYTFPWQMRLLSGVMKVAPEGVLRRLSPRSRTRSSR